VTDVEAVAQYTPTESNSVLIFLPLLLVVGLAFIPARIAGRKGYSALAFYVFGFFLFLPALIVAIVIRDKRLSGLPASASGPISAPANELAPEGQPASEARLPPPPPEVGSSGE
jgi:hypothetical protein